MSPIPSFCSYVLCLPYITSLLTAAPFRISVLSKAELLT
uniref:Uncharacterized protein n=1 Tax=Arundo donax TaxID=35708 RepID=A0A0A9BCN0_ARUDO